MTSRIAVPSADIPLAPADLAVTSADLWPPLCRQAEAGAGRRGLVSRTAGLLWRVARVALPVQALLLLGLAALALYGDGSAHCPAGANNLAASVQTMLNYPDGGPPV